MACLPLTSRSGGNKVFQIVDSKISSLKNKIKPARVNKIHSNHVVINYLNDLQGKYVMTPIDKADSNVAFINSIMWKYW